MGDTWGNHDMQCFVGLSQFGVEADENGVVYRRPADSQNPEVMVIQEKHPQSDGITRRILIFKDGQGNCNGQASTACSNIRNGIAEVSLLGSSDGSKDDCDAKVCVPDARKTVYLPGAGYVRSMVGALHGLLAVDSPKVLSIGFGAGTMAMAVQSKLKGVQQTVVELSG